VVLSYGFFVAEDVLSQTKRVIAWLLLAERSENQTADEVGKSVPMTFKHIRSFSKIWREWPRGAYGCMARAVALMFFIWDP
jgi:hypothetical protein